MKKSQKGFSAIEGLLILVILGILGFVGWYVWNAKNTADKNFSSAAVTQPTNKKATATTNDSYISWKTYTSPLSSGLSFKYPAEWSFTPPTSVFTNNAGGQENNVTLYSVTPTTKAGEGAAIPTNQFMCVTFDEYGGSWQGGDRKLGSLLSSEEFQSGSTNIMLNTYKGDSPMQDQMLLITNPSNSNGNHYISTKNNYYVAVTAQFNCQQGGFPAGANLNADFNSQPETATAKLIMKSIQF
jgi:cytoskeletal protein RodZ